MPQRILVLRLAPPETFAALLGELRRRYPACSITSLAASDEVAGADDHIDWRGLGGRAVTGRLRRERFDLMVVAHGRDHYGTAAYWRAVGLAVASGARRVAFSEEGRWPGRGLAGALVAGVAGGILRWAQEAFAAGLSLLLLLLVLGATAIADSTEASGGGRTGGPSKTR